MQCYLSKPDRLCLSGLMSRLDVLLVSTSVLFLVRINHLHYCYVCILEGGFSWFKHSWCLRCICLLPIRRLRNHFKALNHGLTVFMYADIHTHTFSARQSSLGGCVCVHMTCMTTPYNKILRPGRRDGCVRIFSSILAVFSIFPGQLVSLEASLGC